MKKKIKDFIINLTKDWSATHLFGLVSILILVGVAVFFSCLKEYSINSERKYNERVIEQCSELADNIETVDGQIALMETRYHDNVLNIYNRILVIKDESPNDVRDKVIDSVSSLGIDMDDTVALEAFVLALLRNYEELENDIYIQTYLNNNIELLSKLEENKKIRESLINALEEFESTYITTETDARED